MSESSGLATEVINTSKLWHRKRQLPQEVGNKDPRDDEDRLHAARVRGSHHRNECSWLPLLRNPLHLDLRCLLARGKVGQIQGFMYHTPRENRSKSS